MRAPSLGDVGNKGRPRVMSLQLANQGGELSVVALGAHPDDIEIGCGGSLLALLAARPTVVRTVVFSGPPPRDAEARRAADVFLKDAVRARTDVMTYRDGFLPASADSIKECLLELAETTRAQLVFTPSLEDAHQDHRLLGQLCWQVFRKALILEYEIPKRDPEQIQYSFIVPLSTEIVETKIRNLCDNFPSQHARPWFDPELFRGLMRVRGMQAGVRYAEAFVSRRSVVDFSSHSAGVSGIAAGLDER